MDERNTDQSGVSEKYQKPIAVWLVSQLDFIYSRFEWIVLGLLTIILLLPKFQFISIDATYVNVRVEDFLIALVYGLWVLGFIGGRFSFSKIFNYRIIVLYLFYGLVITLLGIFVFKTVSEPHLGILHWLRRFEYIGMYFVTASVARKENLHKYIYTLLIVGVITWVYGVLQWQDILPGVHTLSKSGEIGTFSELGYVISTFAAHYDYGAFLILMVMLSVWGYFSHGKWWKKVLFVVLALGFWWMSRLVYGRAAYLGMLVGLVVILAIKFSAWVVLPLYEILMTFDRYMGGRFSKYSYQVNISILPQAPTPTPVQVAQELNGNGNFFTQQPAPLYDKYQQVERELVHESGVKRWLDQAVGFLSDKLRTWFGRLNLDLDPSANIRLQEWQDALARVGYNFLWGAGYFANGTNTNSVGGMDNDYLRHIVEVGVIGLALFMLIIFDFARVCWRAYREITLPHLRYFHLAMIGFIIGLAVEAIFIDIFEASKIAMLFWYLMGLVSLFAGMRFTQKA